MSCSQVDLKAYFLGEADQAERHGVEEHVRSCQSCREELERLRATRSALSSLRDEEVPRRITFVSDKVFEPRWWQRFWDSAPRVGFAAAAMLSLAILVHAFVRPATVTAPATANTAALEARVGQELDRRLQAAVDKAVAEHDARQSRRMEQLLAASERRIERQQADLRLMEETVGVLQKKMAFFYRASNDFGGPR